MRIKFLQRIFYYDINKIYDGVDLNLFEEYNFVHISIIYIIWRRNPKFSTIITKNGEMKFKKSFKELCKN